MAHPDFDRMDQDELMAFWSKYHRPTRKDAEALVGDRRPGFTNVAAALANYACNRAVVLSCKERGDKDAAAVYEHAVRLCYDRLPSDVQCRLPTPRA